MDDYLNNIFNMAVTFAACFAILLGIFGLMKKDKNNKIYAGLLILGGLLILIFFKYIMGDNIVPLG